MPYTHHITCYARSVLFPYNTAPQSYPVIDVIKCLTQIILHATKGALFSDNPGLRKECIIPAPQMYSVIDVIKYL